MMNMILLDVDQFVQTMLVVGQILNLGLNLS